MSAYLFVMWALQFQYFALFALAITAGNTPKAAYWFGVLVLNFGVMLMK